MCTFCSHSSPSVTVTYPSLICTPPSRSALTSVPCSTTPHSSLSIRSKRYDAWRLLATSPGATFFLPFLAISGHRARPRARGAAAQDGLPGVLVVVGGLGRGDEVAQR